MAKSPADKQRDYRQRMKATHARMIVYLPRDLAASAASKCLQLGVSMSELLAIALKRLDDSSKR